MPKLPSYRPNTDSSKYSTFSDDPSSTEGAISNENLKPTTAIFSPITLTKNRNPRRRKSLWCCCRCCLKDDEDASDEDVDAEFALVKRERDVESGLGNSFDGVSRYTDKSFGTPKDSGSKVSTLRSGEKTAKFVSEVLTCRDLFLQKLEFANDGTLGRKSREIPHIKVNEYASDDEGCPLESGGTPPRVPRRTASPTPPHTPLSPMSPHSTMSPLQSRDPDDDIDRMVALHHNRSGLQTRSESMASVYSGAGDGNYGTVTVKGQVEFGLLYNYKMGALEINVKQCRDLAPVDAKRQRSDPYVKVYLLPDKSKSGKRKTKVRKHTLRPVFDETLRFIQPLHGLGGRSVWLSVWHADMFGRNDFLGEVILSLEDKVFDDPTPKWYNLQERTEQFEEQQGSKGDLIVGLKFEIPEHANMSSVQSNRVKGTLHVLVKEAKNLCATKPNGQSDVFCKSYLLPERGRSVKQKTPVARRTLSPRWEHCFLYRSVSLADLQQRALELSVWDRDRLSSNDFMGGVRFSVGTGTYMGAQVQWMDSVGKEVSLWQTMMQRPNFWVEGSVPLRPSLSN